MFLFASIIAIKLVLCAALEYENACYRRRLIAAKGE